MRMPPMPHPHLIILRSVATVLLSLIIAQAGWASALLGGAGDYLRQHQIGAWLTLSFAMVTAIAYLVLRRSAGPVNVGLAIAAAVAITVQFTLGMLEVRAVHIFLGILIVGLTTALTSWTYRHTMPEDARAYPAPVTPEPSA
jgi:hypothetical protein